jgi:hypothetical protein
MVKPNMSSFLPSGKWRAVKAALPENDDGAMADRPRDTVVKQPS